jgi:hypothetical protein
VTTINGKKRRRRTPERSGNWRRRWRAPWGCWRQVQQRSPLKLKTLMAGPLRVLAAGPAVTTIEVEDVDGGPPGVLAVGLAAATTEVEDVDSGPLGGAGSIFDSGHHRSPSDIQEVSELNVRERPPST